MKYTVKNVKFYGQDYLKDGDPNKGEYMNVLSLFDGISCGQIALERAGVKVDKYYASEIEPNAIKVTQHNYPNTIQIGDVTKAYRQWFHQRDLLIGGSFPRRLFLLGDTGFNGKQGCSMSF